MKPFSNLTLLFCAVFLLSACSELELGSHIAKTMSGDNRPTTGDFKVGNPYTIKGRTYYPKESYAHSETGIASWYGPGFHGKRTANGEIFNRNELTAAHKTLQMPSMVRVTNLENGRSIVVRINDRGPYAHGRIIDLSEKAAELLGIKAKGTAKVRVDVLEEESRIVASAAKRGLSTRGSEVALNRTKYRRKIYERDMDNRLILARAEEHPLAYWKQGMEMPTPVNKPGVAIRATENRTPFPSNEFEAILLENSQPIKKPSYAKKNVTVAGHSNNGDFYPDAVVTRKPVKGMPKNIFVEIGDFINEDAAYTLRNALYTIEEPITVLRRTENNQILYKIQIGPVATVEKADKILNMLIQQGRDAEIVVATR